jgi:hypothetical protein
VSISMFCLCLLIKNKQVLFGSLVIVCCNGNLGLIYNIYGRTCCYNRYHGNLLRNLGPYGIIFMIMCVYYFPSLLMGNLLL